MTVINKLPHTLRLVIALLYGGTENTETGTESTECTLVGSRVVSLSNAWIMAQVHVRTHHSIEMRKSDSARWTLIEGE